jgi:hypothetical protein
LSVFNRLQRLAEKVLPLFDKEEGSMWKPTKIVLILAIAGALEGLPSLTAGQQAAAQKDPDAAGVAEAIRFQKAEQAAADRQARIEEAREHGANSADRMAPQPKKPVKATRPASASRKTPPPQQQNPQ